LENLQNKLSFVISNLIALAGVGANVYQSKQGQKHPGMVMGTLFANGVCVCVCVCVGASCFANIVISGFPRTNFNAAVVCT